MTLTPNFQPCFRYLSCFILKPPRFDPTMANLHAELRVTLTENGIPDTSPLLDYLDWAGIRTKNSLAMFFADADKITEWTEKFQNEITFGTPEKKIHFPESDRRKGLQACFIAAWHICRDDFDAARHSKLPTPTPLPLTPTPVTTPSSADDKIPKTWPKGVYQQLLTDYKTSTDNTKTFPEKILIGAEKIIVRMWHEHTTSKNYQAVGLGEIITNRTFTATGAVNSTAKRDKSDKTLVLDTEHNTLVHQEQKDWDPQSMMMILDPLDAIRWAWILSRSPAEGPSTTTSRGSSSSLARIHNAYQTPKRPGTPSHGLLRCGCATTSPSNKLPKRFSRIQLPLPIPFLNQSARRSIPTRTRARSKAKARANTKARPTHGRTITDTNPIRVQPISNTPFLQHLLYHNLHTSTGHHHSPPHTSQHLPSDNTRARRANMLPIPKAEANHHRNRDSTATGKQHTSQLTDPESKPCCKALFPTDPLSTFHFSPV